VKGLETKGVMTFHDKVKGAELGTNIILHFKWTASGWRIWATSVILFPQSKLRN